MHPCRCPKPGVLATIRSFSSLPYGWDGDAGLPVRPDALAFCEHLFGNGSPVCLEGLGEPEVSLGADGTIRVDLTGRGGRELRLTFVSNWVVAFVQAFGDGETTIEGVIRHARPDDNERFTGLLRWAGAGGEP